MDLKQYVLLVKKLAAKTSEGSASWEKTASDSVFQTAVSDYSIRLSKVFQPWGETEDAPDYFLALFNNQGQLIESVSHAELQQADPSFEAYSFMAELFRNARRNAMGAENAVSEILKGLDGLLPF